MYVNNVPIAFSFRVHLVFGGTQSPQEPKVPRNPKAQGSIQQRTALLEADGVTRLEVDDWQGAGND